MKNLNETMASTDPGIEVDRMLDDWQKDADIEIKAATISAAEADQILEKAWQAGGVLYAFLFDLGSQCGSHMMQSEPHSCCSLEISDDTRKALQGHETSDGESVIRTIRDQYEDGAHRCPCCHVVYDTCVRALAENERRKSLQMISEEE